LLFLNNEAAALQPNNTLSELIIDSFSYNTERIIAFFVCIRQYFNKLANLLPIYSLRKSKQFLNDTFLTTSHLTSIGFRGTF